jgi:hypothetical protein
MAGVINVRIKWLTVSIYYNNKIITAGEYYCGRSDKYRKQIRIGA